MKAGWNSFYCHTLQVLRQRKTAFISNVLAFDIFLMGFGDVVRIQQPALSNSV